MKNMVAALPIFLSFGNDGRGEAGIQRPIGDRSRPVPTPQPSRRRSNPSGASRTVAHKDVCAALKTGCFPAPQRGAWGASPPQCASRAQSSRFRSNPCGVVGTGRDLSLLPANAGMTPRNVATTLSSFPSVSVRCRVSGLRTLGALGNPAPHDPPPV